MFMLFGLGGAITQVAVAAVTEPNGDVVPVLKPTKEANYSETSIQEYFNANDESGIDAVAAARTEPGKFSPLCSFDATLVLSQSQAAAGISWYNVDETNPTKVPSEAEVFEVLKPTTTTNGTISAASIRADSRYAGGYVGFALTRYDNGTDKPQIAVFYSEYQRNRLCSNGCSPAGHWIASLAYRSTRRSDTYYIAFEDWPMYGADASAWNNDGDFNDKVFKIVGISCAGGGVECSTGGLGLCGKGVSECAPDGGKPTCTPLYTARAEVCDAIDNDCNGQVDDGDLCPKDQICLRGSCVFPCGSTEFKCPDSLVCGDTGFCIEAACAKVTCGEGLACRNGICTSPCSDVVCPIGQTCVDAVCKDLCAGKVCGLDSVCQNGACVGTCTCVPCTGSKKCDLASGKCLELGCENVTCEPNMACVGGVCVDTCTGAKCPGGAACSNGTCAAPPPSSVGGSASASGGAIVIGTITTGSTGAGTVPGATNGSGGAAASPILGQSDSGCSCRLIRLSSRKGAGLLALLGLCLSLLRRRPRQS